MLRHILISSLAHSCFSPCTSPLRGSFADGRGGGGGGYGEGKGEKESIRLVLPLGREKVCEDGEDEDEDETDDDGGAFAGWAFRLAVEREEGGGEDL